MGQRAIEIVLMRQLASYLAGPILIVDHQHDLLFFNESAEPILGRRFDETGEIRRSEWNRLFRPTDANGAPIPTDQTPLARAIDRKEPSHRRSWLTGLDGVARVIEGLAFPLETRDAGLLGATGIFWEVREDAEPVPPATPARSAPAHSQHEVEVVLLRRLADRLTMPIFVIDADGRLLFYNPPAEPLLGRRFAHLGPVELRDWYDAFQPTDEDGSVIKREDHPLYVALRKRQPNFRRFRFQGLDGVERTVEGTAFPLLGQCDRHLGAVGIFWEGAR
jgi:PAS domain-containing protein